MTVPDLSTISEPRRQEILRIVWNHERCAGDIAAAMPVSFSAVSQHLAVLLDAGFVRQRRDGRKRWYIADKHALGPFAAAFEAVWLERLATLKSMAEAEQKEIDRTQSRAAPTRRTRHGSQRKKHGSR